jgi:hypothetical protein
LLFGFIDSRVGGSVYDDVRLDIVANRRDLRMISEIELLVSQGDQQDRLGRGQTHKRGAHLPGRARHQNPRLFPHHALELTSPRRRPS